MPDDEQPISRGDFFAELAQWEQGGTQRLVGAANSAICKQLATEMLKCSSLVRNLAEHTHKQHRELEAQLSNTVHKVSTLEDDHRDL